MFAKQKLSSAIAIALGASVAALAPMQSANADSAFFPHMVASDTVTTIFSVINTSTQNYNVSGGFAQPGEVQNLHYRLYYKQLTGVNDNAKVCEEFNEFLPTSYNDIQTIDIGAEFGANTKGVLFNDPSVNNNWVASGKDYALARNVKPARGYLVVDNAASGGNTVTGEAYVFEFANGATWGYQAYTRPGEVLTGAPEFDYEASASASPTQVAIMPFAETSTAFMVTPLNDSGAVVVPPEDMVPEFQNNYQASIAFRTATGGFALYDRDENPVSGSVPRDVTCIGRIDAQDLLSVGAQPRLADGGWGSLYNRRVNVPGRTGAAAPQWTEAGAVVIKLEYNVVDTFNGEPTNGVFNNAFVLRPAQENGG